MIGAIAYDDPAKDAWRGWKWNAIANAACGFNDRIPPREKARRLSEKTVLYLVGPDDHDRKRALARGFANHNLIAIDLVQERVDEVRRAGGLAICGSLQQVLLNWPHDWPIDVIDADLCSGITKDVIGLARCLLACPAFESQSVLSLNMMRGRDAESNELRSTLNAMFPQYKHGAKHRGLNWSMHLAIEVIAMGKCNPTHEAVGVIFEIQRASINSYRSKTSGQFFDSCVHRWGITRLAQPDVSSRDWERERKQVGSVLSSTCSSSVGVRHRIAALRAVRTMKMRAV